MSKQSFNLDFALWDLHKLLECAGYTGSFPPELEPSDLEMLEKKYDLPTLPKTIGPVREATQLLMRFIIEEIRHWPPETAD